jgi:hypothetical protein
MPEEFWGHPWSEWLPDVCGSYYRATQIHKQKNLIYLSLIEQGEVPLLSGGEAFKHLQTQSAPLAVVTASSLPAARAAFKYHGFDPGTAYYHVPGGVEREPVLERLVVSHTMKMELPVYVDDHPCNSGFVRSIHYTPDMTKDELLEAIAWTP